MVGAADGLACIFLAGVGEPADAARHDEGEFGGFRAGTIHTGVADDFRVAR